MKVCTPRQRQRFGQVEQSTTTGKDKDAQGAGNFKPDSLRERRSFALINEHEIGVEFRRQPERRFLAVIESV